MGIATNIIKRLQLSEPFNERKLYTSIYAACLSASAQVGVAEITAQRICMDVLPWLHKKTEVTTTDIRHQAANYLKRYNPDAAYVYLHHRIIG